MKKLFPRLAAIAFGLLIATPVFAVSGNTPQPIVNISASNTSINQGDSVTITWSSQYAASCSNGSSGFDSTWDSNWSQGSVTLTPPSLPATYTVTCNNGNGGVVSNAITIRQVANPGACNITVYSNTTQNFFFETDANKGAGGSATPDMFIQWYNNSTHDNKQVSSLGGTGFDPATGDDTFSADFSWSTPGSYTIIAYVPYSTDPFLPTNAGTNPSQNDTLTSGGQTAASANQPVLCNVTVIDPKPNLVPGSAPLVTGTVGQNVSISGTITNNGTADAGGSTVGFISNGDLETTGIGGVGQNGSTGFSGTFPASVFPSPGTYSYEYCADYYGNVDESNEGDNCVTGQISMNNPPTPDLGVGSVSSLTGIVGQPVTLSIPVTNYGNADSGGFPVLFWSNDGTLFADSGYISVPQSQTVNAYLTTTFSNPGTYSVSACANRDTSWNMVIGDPNTSNDCSGTTNITIYAVPTASVSISPSSLAYGGSATLSWSCANGATSCTSGDFDTGGNFSGSITISPTVSTSYTVWSNGPGGTTSAGQTLTVGQPYPDVTASADAPVTTVLGNSFNVTGTVYNIGSAPMNGPFSVMAQVCDSNGPCNNYNASYDTQIGTVYNGQSQGVNITVGPTSSSGSYYYRICADIDKYWNQPNNESNEGNNCSGWQSINVIAPDLTTGGIPTVYGDWGQSVSVAGTAVSDGNADAGGFNNMFITNWNGSSWQTIIDGSGIGGLGQGNSTNFYGTFPASAFANPGSYNYGYCVGLNSSWQWSMAESNGNNNCISGGTIVIRAPDLVASDISPTSGIVGSPINFYATASNIGNGASGSFPVLFQVMNGDIFNSGYVGSIGAGGNAGAGATYTFSSPGTYQVRACVNRNAAWQVITLDSNYGNDCGNWDTVTVYSIPTASLSLSPSSVAYGGATTITWSCASGATSCAGGNFNTGGALSGSVTVSATQNTTYTVWSNGPGGTTSASQTLTVGQPYPDLTATAGPAASGPVNTNIPLSATISNIGNAATPGQFYNMMQICNGYGACDTYNNNIANGAPIGPLAAGASQVINLTTYLSTPGNYSFRACADMDIHWGTIITESNEGNNCSNWQTITVTAPDLTVSPGATVTGLMNSTISLSGTVNNIGNASTPGSFNNVIQICDSNCATYNRTISAGTSALGNGASRTITMTTSIANAGTYFYQTCADFDASWNSSVVESNEGNNCSGWQSITITGPNLTAGIVSPTTATAGTAVNFSAVTSNTGNGASGSFPVLFQIQNGTSFDSAYTPALAAGASRTVSASYTFGTAGTYQIRACANLNTSGVAITPESNYGDNCSNYTTVTVNTAPLPDLAVGAYPNVTVTLGQTIPLTGTVSNTGTAAAGSFNNIFLTNFNSAQNTWSTIVAGTRITSLSTGGTASISVTLPANTFTAPGSYYYAYCADMNTSWAGTVNESNENNNCSGYGVITVKAVTQPDLVAGSAPTVTATQGSNVTVTGTVTNNGNASATGPFANLFKANQTQSGWNTVIGGSSGATLAAGATESISATFPASTFTAPGSYAYQYCADENVSNGWSGTVTESHEDNNCSPVGDIEIQQPVGLPDFTQSAVSNKNPGQGDPSTVDDTNYIDLAAGITMNGGDTTQSYSFPIRLVFDKPVYMYEDDGSGNKSWVLTTSYAGPGNATISTGQAQSDGSYGWRVKFPSPGAYTAHACANQNNSGVNILTESVYNNDCGPDTTFTSAPSTCNLSFSPTSLPVGGGNVTINWSSLGDSNKQCTGDGFSTGGAGSGSVSQFISNTTTFGVSCTYDSTYSPSLTLHQACTANGTVPVQPTTPGNGGSCSGGGTLTLVATPNRVLAGSRAKLAWTATNTKDSCTLVNSKTGEVLDTSDPGQCDDVEAGNNITIGPLNNQSIYTLTCGSGATQSTKQVIVNVVPRFSQF